MVVVVPARVRAAVAGRQFELLVVVRRRLDPELRIGRRRDLLGQFAGRHRQLGQAPLARRGRFAGRALDGERRRRQRQPNARGRGGHFADILKRARV